MSYYQLQPEPETPVDENRASSSALRGAVAGAVAFFGVSLLLLALLLIGYARIAADLPLPDELAQRAAAFRSTRIFDRDGNLLSETFDPNAGRRVPARLEEISPWLVQATIATEDANFYQHPGVDPVALARAVYYAVQEREFVSGASTIPQQLVKLVFLSPERSARRKIEEAILAAEVSRRYSKDEILELYLNEVYYGNLAYGVDVAAEAYFRKSPAELALSEAALLAGLPQAPAFYDPYSFPERAKERQAIVLRLMVEAGAITPEQADAAWQEPLVYQPISYEIQAPHFTLYVRQQLEELLGPEALYKVGLQVTTSLDSGLQQQAETAVQAHVATLAARNVSNGALVAMDPRTGEVLALVGSAGFENVEIDGQVNMALAPRQPGSSIKPFVYLAAFEQQAWTPGTLVADIEEEFPDGANEPYRPRNYDEREHGILTVRAALANSYNIPAVRALQAVGLPGFLELMQRLGVTTLTRPDYGLSLSLGGGEMSLLELTGSFAVLANGGQAAPPQTILEVIDSSGNIICGGESEVSCRRGGFAQGTPLVSPVDAFLITDVLQDNAARVPVFGPNSALNLGRPAAAKTGTTNDFRDALTVGYTPQLVAGVWVGNADNSEMQGVSGAAGAAPIWNRFMSAALADEPVVDFAPPEGVQQFDVCADTGTLPSEACPQTARRWFAADRPPLPPEEDLWQEVAIDRTTGRLATEFTPESAIERVDFKVYPPEYREWAIANGIPQPPTDASEVFTFAPQVEIVQPPAGAIVQGVVEAVGVANVSAFASYELQYGVSHDPGAFSPPIWGPVNAPVAGGTLGRWDTSGLQNGPHTLRLLVRDQVGNEYESRVLLFVENPQPTATPTTEATAAPTPSWTPTRTPEPAQPVDPPQPTPTWTPEPGPADPPPVPTLPSTSG